MGFFTLEFVEFLSTAPRLLPAINTVFEQIAERTNLVFVQISALFIHFLAQNRVTHA